jgi:hypothetical protein
MIDKKTDLTTYKDPNCKYNVLNKFSANLNNIHYPHGSTNGNITSTLEKITELLKTFKTAQEKH